MKWIHQEVLDLVRDENHDESHGRCRGAESGVSGAHVDAGR